MQQEERMKKVIFLSVIVLAVLIIISCKNDSTNTAVMGVEFQWLPIDHGSSKNPEILLTDVPEGTKRFHVSLIDLDLKSYDHGDGLVDNDNSGIIARGTIQGNYNGPSPMKGMIHNYEITVKAYDEKDTVIGIGKKAKKFLH